MKRFLFLYYSVILSIFQFKDVQTVPKRSPPLKSIEGIDLSEDGTLIVNIANGQIFRPGEDQPIATIDIPRPKRQDSFLAQTTNGGKYGDQSVGNDGSLSQFWRHDNLGDSSHGCIVLYNTQKFCDVYNLPWAPNGSARVCKADMQEPPRMPSSYAVSRAGIFTLLGIISLTSNCLIIWAVVVSGGLQKPVYWLFGGLSSSSIVLVVSQSLVLIPQTLVTVEQTWILGEFSCYLINVLSTISTVSSTMFILLIAFERYISTKNPQQATSMFSLKRAQVSILVNWTLSFAYGCCWVTFIEFDMCVLNNGEMIDRCQLRPLDIGRAVMSVTEGFFLLALPLAASVILLVQTSTPAVVQSPRHQMGTPAYPQHTNPSSGYLLHQRFASPPGATVALSTSSRHSQLLSTATKNEKPYSLVRLMLLVLISYILLAAPRRLMELYIFSSTDISNKYFTETVLYTLMYINTALYPFLILLMSSNMRRAIRQFIKPKNTRGRLYTHEMSAQNVTQRANKMQAGFRSSTTGGQSARNGSGNVAGIAGVLGSNRSASPDPRGGQGQQGQGQQEVSVSFIHVSPSGNHLNRLSSIASYSRSVSSNSSDRHSSSSTDSMSSYDVSDDVFYSFAPPKVGTNNSSPGGKSIGNGKPPIGVKNSPIAKPVINQDQPGTSQSGNSTPQSTISVPTAQKLPAKPTKAAKPLNLPVAAKDKTGPSTSDA